jgi:hypothetical protein
VGLVSSEVSEPFRPLLDERSKIPRVVRFGSTIRTNLMMGTPENATYGYVWRSATLVVTITYEICDRNEEILRRYLEKYPPSDR